jgi:LysR family hydrogen peroxide-inducible transcriptional activator
MNIIDHLEKLSVLLVVRDTGSLKRAAEVLHVTQPAVTRTIQTLETICGGELLRRTPKGVLFTPRGLALAEMASEIREVVRRREPSLAAANDDISGRFGIGTFESIAIFFWPQVLRKLQLVLPNLEVSLQTGRSAAQMSALIDGKIDLAVTVAPPRRKEIETVELFDDHLELYGAAAAGSPSSTLIVFTDALSQYQEEFDRCLRTVKIKATKRILTDSFEVVRAMTVQGAGIGILPTRVANAKAPGSGLKRLCAGSMAKATKHYICASYKRSKVLRPTVRAVTQVLLEAGIS